MTEFPRRIGEYDVVPYTIDLPRGPLILLGPANPDALLDDPLTERRFHAEDGHMPYWARPWAASIMLAEYLESRVELPAHFPAPPRVLEIGCGLGLAGLAAARLGWSVTLTDYDDAPLEFCAATGALNDISAAAIQRLDWRSAAATGRYDVILAADVLFERRWNDPVAEFIATQLGQTGLALIADPNRRTAEDFPAALAARRLVFQKEAAYTTQPDNAPTQGTIYRITPA